MYYKLGIMIIVHDIMVNHNSMVHHEPCEGRDARTLVYLDWEKEEGRPRIAAKEGACSPPRGT